MSDYLKKEMWGIIISTINSYMYYVYTYYVCIYIYIYTENLKNGSYYLYLFIITRFAKI